MFRKVKKFIILIPCMIFAFFLVNGTKIMAGNAKLVDSVVVKVENSDKKENTYYFTNNSVWEFKTDYKFIPDEVFLRWRVVNPEGKATEWSDKVGHIKAKGKFIINDYKSLAYTEEDDSDIDRFSIASENTYYVDIKYFDQVLWPIDKKRDETLKIVVKGDDSLMTPFANISYDKNTNKFTLSAGFDSNGQNIISTAGYLFADDSVAITTAVEFKTEYMNTVNASGLPLVNLKNYVAVVDADDTADKLYFLVTTPHGYEVLVEYLIEEDDQGGSVDEGVVDVPDTDDQQGENTDGQQNKNENEDNKGGLGDYGFGQLILIILVVVLVVSCALIITQKIVDYKKRLY